MKIYQSDVGETDVGSIQTITVDGRPSEIEARALAVHLVSDLALRSRKIAVAESCTGGLIGSLITDWAGSSSVFEVGIISYSNDAKFKLLGVSQHTLTTKGAVSRECVLSMANGVRLLSKADYGIAVSGIAGPGGGTKYKSVGTVYFGFSSEDENISAKVIFKLNRVETKLASACVALSLALDCIRRGQ